MAAPLKEYDDKYDWVKVKANRKVNFGKREWNNYNNVPVSEGEVLVLPRGEQGVDAEDFDMTYYFRNNFFEIVDPEPDVSGSNVSSADPEPVESDEGDDEETFVCEDCERDFDSERGLRTHRSQMHENREDNKNEEED